MDDLDAGILREVTVAPGQKGTSVIASFNAIDHIPRHLCAAAIARLVTRGKVLLDGEQRLWPN